MNEPNSDSELDALFAQARSRRPDPSAAEYAFETRLMARLRNSAAPESIWARASWRMLPFFATCVVVLAVWHAQVASETQEAEQVVYAETPDMVELWSHLN